MALAVTKVGRADPPAQVIGTATQSSVLAIWVVKVVIQASDYSSGILLSTIATALSVRSIVTVLSAAVQIADGTNVPGIPSHDIKNGKFRWLTALTPTDYSPTNNDIFTLTVVTN